MRFWHVAVAIVPLILTGCTHHQLRWNTVKQARTVSDAHTQQVLDNLAKFAENQGALAHFSWPNAGSSRVTDDVSSDGRLTWNPFGLTSAFLNLGGGRQSVESWTMTPINDAKKLELMSCAYQRAVSRCCGCGESGHCPNCEKRFNKFYLGKETPPEDTYLGQPLFRVKPSVSKVFFAMDGPGYGEIQNTHLEVYSDVGDSDSAVSRLATVSLLASVGTLVYADALGNPLSAEHLDRVVSENLAEYTARTGRTTAECLHVPCWFHVGCRPEIPKDCRYIGRHRGTYLWVPESGIEQLTALTLTILDIAQNDPPGPRTKEVEVYLDKTGALTNGASKAAYKVTAKIPFNSSIATVVSSNTIDRTIQSLAFQAQEVDTSRWYGFINPQAGKAKKDEFAAANQSLREQRAGLESERKSLQFLPPKRTPVPNAGFLEFQQNLDALTPNDFAL